MDKHLHQGQDKGRLVVDKDLIDRKIREYHETHDGGKIPVYTNVVIIAETLACLTSEDMDCVAIILHDGNELEKVFHLTADAALKLAVGIDELFDAEEEAEDELD